MEYQSKDKNGTCEHERNIENVGCLGCVGLHKPSDGEPCKSCKHNKPRPNNRTCLYKNEKAE